MSGAAIEFGPAEARAIEARGGVKAGAIEVGVIEASAIEVGRRAALKLIAAPARARSFMMEALCFDHKRESPSILLRRDGFTF